MVLLYLLLMIRQKVRTPSSSDLSEDTYATLFLVYVVVVVVAAATMADVILLQ